MAVMIPTNYTIVKCVEALIAQHVDPNSKTSVIISTYCYPINYVIIFNLFSANI